MYNAIIVDDEKMIRMGMLKAVSWENIGIDKVFTAKSGNEALEIIKEEKPQLMITDINMSDMTGLELIEYTKKITPDIRIIVITGYNKFEYARQCIKLEVHDFLLKPIDKDTLEMALHKQIDFLLQVKTVNPGESSRNRVKAVAEQLVIEKIMKDIVYNRIPAKKEYIEEFCSQYHYDVNQNIQAAIIVPTLYMEDGSINESFTALSVKNICSGMVDAQNRGITFLDDDGRIVIAFFLDKHKGSIMEWLQELNEILCDEYNKRPKVVVGNPVNGLQQFYISYNDACVLLKSQDKEFSDIIQNKNFQKREKLFWDVYVEMKNAMSSNIGDSDKIMNIFERFRQATDSYNLSDNIIRRCCFEMASSIYYMFIWSTGKEADERLNSLIVSLLEMKGEDLFKVTRLFLIKLLGNKEDHNIHEIIDQAKRFINGNLSEELSVSNIASNLYVSASYFSRLFKKVTGEGCNEYIVRKRIEKAVLLLKTTDFKTNKIAVMVGYKDTNYFSLAIKKHTGMSPTRYREIHQKLEG